MFHRRSSLPSTQSVPVKPKPNAVKFPPRVLIGVAAAILIPLLIAAGVMLKLKLPGGGELIVDCDDPNAKIQVVAVKDGQREDLSVTSEVGNKLRLSEGRWTILIEGVDAAEFALSENEIVINGGTPASIRVTRRDDFDGQAAENRSTAPTSTKRICTIAIGPGPQIARRQQRPSPRLSTGPNYVQPVTLRVLLPLRRTFRTVAMADSTLAAAVDTTRAWLNREPRCHRSAWQILRGHLAVRLQNHGAE